MVEWLKELHHLDRKGYAKCVPVSDAWPSWAMTFGALRLIIYEIACMSFGPNEGE